MDNPAAACCVLKTIDLKAAYKQLAISPLDRAVAVISTWDPTDNSVKGCAANALPFGSVASVGHFNRVARLLQRRMQELWVMAYNYFDDYPLLELSILKASADRAVKLMLDLFGFRWALDKDRDFDESAELLGVAVRISSGPDPGVYVGNKPGRADAIAEALLEIIDARLGRSGRLALADLSLRWMERCAHEVRLNDLDGSSCWLKREGGQGRRSWAFPVDRLFRKQQQKRFKPF